MVGFSSNSFHTYRFCYLRFSVMSIFMGDICYLHFYKVSVRLLLGHSLIGRHVSDWSMLCNV